MHARFLEKHLVPELGLISARLKQIVVAPEVWHEACGPRAFTQTLAGSWTVFLDAITWMFVGATLAWFSRSTAKNIQNEAERHQKRCWSYEWLLKSRVTDQMSLKP